MIDLRLASTDAQQMQKLKCKMKRMTVPSLPHPPVFEHRMTKVDARAWNNDSEEEDEEENAYSPDDPRWVEATSQQMMYRL